MYHEFAAAPLKDYDTVESLEDYPYWPDVNKFDYDTAVEAAQKAAKNFAVLGPGVSFYEIYCQLRGLEDALMDLMLKPELADAILDRIENCQTEMMKRLFTRAAEYFDLCFNDEVDSFAPWGLVDFCVRFP